MDKHISIVFKRWNCHILNCGSNKIVSTIDYQFSAVQSLSHMQLFRAPWTTAYQASLSSLSPPAFNFSHHQAFPASGYFQMSQLFESGSQSTGVSASTSFLKMNTRDWSPLGETGLISLQSKGLSRFFSNITVQNHQLFGAQLSF